ncbi:hypothetical protein ACIBG8_54040 [Nonomuraea sp. NPDC050556]|uniref:hypothetical protein n=1 Tax=Nonomuraea sp. NPDC050556 TaxID=3364369 RepID=UPI00379DB3A1
MAIYTLMSPGNAPGVTTTALAVSYAWDGRALLAECDPKGGSVLQGFLTGQMEGHKGGLLELALALAHNPNPAVLWEYVVSLDHDAREWLLLPGLKDPRHIVQLDGAWDTIADVLTTATDSGVDIVLDLGQIGRPDTPMRLIAASDLAIMLLRPSLRQVADARPRLDALGRYVGTSVPVALCLVGKGDYTAKQISEALFDLPILAQIPHDPRSAAVLSDGQRTRRSIRRASLMRGAAHLAAAMRQHLASLPEQEVVAG